MTEVFGFDDWRNSDAVDRQGMRWAEREAVYSVGGGGGGSIVSQVSVRFTVGFVQFKKTQQWPAWWRSG